MVHVTNAAAVDLGDSFNITMTGYLREHLSFNLQDPPETTQNDRFDVSMARTVLQLEPDAIWRGVRFHAVGRVVGEVRTDYLKRLDNLPGQAGDLMDEYNKSQLREAYVELTPVSRVMLRLGKQQVVWGETDFFQAMDIVHGFDYTWRSFLEGENEDYRKPIILANALIQVPEARGTLQLFLRPGLDPGRDIGNSYDMFGGRWSLQPNKGVNFFPIAPYNFHHEDADIDDPTWGVRWAGIIGPVNYSLAYLRTFGPDPVVNSAFAPFKSTPIGSVGEFIFPKVDLFGLTLSAASDALDTVFTTEIAYIKDKFYNVGTQFLGGALPGFGGIKEKDTLRLMVRMDKQLTLMSLLGTNQASFFSVQVFDTWIPSFDEKDDIVDLAGYGGAKKEHSAVGTVVLGLNYMNSRVNPTLAGGYDLTYGGGFFIPSVELAFGDKWRFKAEADLFFPNHSKSPGEIETQAHLLGWFANNSQLSLRLTRYF